MQLILLLLAFILSPRTRAGEIIGGHEAKPHSRPYMAYIVVSYTANVMYCGGILIHEKFVLTAAHCLNRTMEPEHENTLVFLGAHNVKIKEKTQQHIFVKRHISHPQYIPSNHSNDIMLLQLEKKAKITKEVKILELPKKKTHVKPGALCQVAGWGKTAPKKTYSKTLQEVELKVQKDEECEDCYSNYTSATQICAGDPNIQRSSFHGDSGGPFMCNKVLQAIICYGDIGGEPPCVFTKISPYLHWIKETMRHLLLKQENEATPATNHLFWA